MSMSQNFHLRLQPGFRVGKLANFELAISQMAKHFGVQTNLSNSLGLDGISRSFLSQTSKSLLRHLQENADAHDEVSLRALRQKVQQESKKKRSTAQHCYGLLIMISMKKKAKNSILDVYKNVVMVEPSCWPEKPLTKFENSQIFVPVPGEKGKPRTD